MSYIYKLNKPHHSSFFILPSKILIFIKEKQNSSFIINFSFFIVVFSLSFSRWRKMLAIFHEAFAHPPEELYSPASEKCSKQPKLPEETLDDFLSRHSDNTFSMSFGKAAVLAYVRPSASFSVHQRLEHI